MKPFQKNILLTIFVLLSLMLMVAVFIFYSKLPYPPLKNSSTSFTPEFLLIFSLLSIVVLCLLYYLLHKEKKGQVSTTAIMEQQKASETVEKIQERLTNERRILFNSFMHAPAAIAIVKGDTFIYEFANAEYEKLVDRKITLGKSVQELFPELEQQGILTILKNVFNTGEPFIANEFPVEILNKKTNELILGYHNAVVQPIKNEKGEIERLLSHGMEVTKQVEVRKQMEETNQKLRIAAILTENIADAVVATDMDHNIISWNKGAENLYGFTSDEVMGKPGAEVLRTQFLSEENKEAWQKDLETTGKWQGEVVQPKKDGTLLSVLVSLAYVFNEKGKPVAAVGVNRNITERKKAEEKIEASEAKFKMLSETIPHLVWTATPDGKKNYFNQYFIDYTGLSFEKLKDDGWQTIIFPADLKKELAQWQQNIKTGEDFIIEKRVRHHTGTYRWHLCYCIPQKNTEGKITGWIGTNTDITEQKSFTEELETKVKERTDELQLQNQTFALAESIAQFGSYSWNLTTGSLAYSDNLFRLLDCEPNEFIPSFQIFLSYIHPDDLHQVIKNGEETMQTGLLIETPYRIISKTGKLKYFRSNGSFIGDGDMRILIGTVQDISKDVEAAEEISKKNLELEIINAELSSFSYIASHDLQEPLRKIQTFSKLIMQAENLSEKTQDYFNRMITASERMQKLIISLLDFSRTNKTEFIFEPCDLNNIIEESKSDLQRVIQDKQAIIEHENLPTINVVRIQLLQLFSNLIDNAIKYSRPEIIPHIRVTCQIIEGNLIEHSLAKKQTKYYAIQFADNGIGFEQQYADKIFELFQRLHGKNEYSGTGIGLGIVKKIAAHHHGFIQAKGRPLIGATFTLYLPIS